MKKDIYHLEKEGNLLIVSLKKIPHLYESFRNCGFFHMNSLIGCAAINYLESTLNV